jgi:uncharacterized membrane protein
MRAAFRPTALFAALIGLVVAAAIVGGIVHFVVILATPYVATDDAYARLASHGRVNETTPLPQAAPGNRLTPFADPAVATAFCLYDVSAGPIRVRAPTGRAFSSISFHTRHGVSFYALTDRAGAHGAIDAVLAKPDDVAAMAAHDDEENPSRDLRIAAPETQGYVMIRVFSELPSLYPEAEADARRLTCTPEPMPH